MDKQSKLDISGDTEFAELTVSLTHIIQKWSDGVCENHNFGWWYDDICHDMAQAAIGVLKASTKGQQHYEKEC